MMSKFSINERVVYEQNADRIYRIVRVDESNEVYFIMDEGDSSVFCDLVPSHMLRRAGCPAPIPKKYRCCREKDRTEAAECMASLCTAIQRAGGDVGSIMTRMKVGMTVMEFIVTVAAQNGIRFHHELEEEQDARADEEAERNDRDR